MQTIVSCLKGARKLITSKELSNAQQKGIYYLLKKSARQILESGTKQDPVSGFLGCIPNTAEWIEIKVSQMEDRGFNSEVVLSWIDILLDNSEFCTDAA